jgi:acyl-coenzyme A thioesterase PaaI-like protein
MLDFALALTALGALEPPKVAVTVSMNLHFEKAVLPGELKVLARIDRLGGRMVFATAVLMPAAHQEILARATAVMAVLAGPK